MELNASSIFGQVGTASR